MTVIAAARRCLGRCVQGATRFAAQAYVAGDTLERAVRVADRWHDRGLGVTLDYWNPDGEDARRVADEYLHQITVLSTLEHGYLSVKLPAIEFSEVLFSEIVERAARQGVRVHVDSHGPKWAGRTREMVDTFLDRGATLSYTLPGRWARSLDDASWAAERGITVRVVKGQWIDRRDPNHELCAGYLRVIDRLAGRARHVAIATHDLTLIPQAVERLRAKGTSTHLELLHGLPMRHALRLADELELAAYVYVPYGKAYLPYALSRVNAEPRIVWWLLRDLLAGCKPSAKASRRRELVEAEL